MNQFCRIVFDANGIHAAGIHTYNPDVAARWAREAPRHEKGAGQMKNPYVVHFDPAHSGWPDAAAFRTLRRCGADCELRRDGVIEVRAPTDAVRRAIAQLNLETHADAGDVIELHAPEGAPQGLDVIRNVHRLHADTVRLPNGDIQVRNLYLYPEAEPGHEPTKPEHFAPQHPLISKRQWAKIPQAISRTHRVIVQPPRNPDKTP